MDKQRYQEYYGYLTMRSSISRGTLLKTTVILPSLIVTISAIGLGLYANELSRQARARREADENAREAAREERRHDLYNSLHTYERASQTFCHPGNEKITPNVNANPGTPAWNRWQCDFAQARHRDVEREIRGMEASK